MTVAEALRIGASVLPEHEGLPSSRREASWLLAHALGVREEWLRLHPEHELPSAAERRYRSWLERRAAGEPAHHLTGECPFWGRVFEVTPDVLVPRPETELLVEVALDLPVAAAARVLDVGAGSGCLSVTLAIERPRWRVVAVDRSLRALEVARRNARRHRAAVELYCGDLAEAVGPPWDLVVANLPYIPTEDIANLPPEVRRDPTVALDGGPDGLAHLGRLLADLPRILRVCGGAVLEVGERQAEAVIVIARDAGLVPARRIHDLSGTERIIVFEGGPSAPGSRSARPA